MITSDTLTDDQIRKLLEELRAEYDGTPEKRQDLRACYAAQSVVEIFASSWTKKTARARVVELLNERARRSR